MIEAPSTTGTPQPRLLILNQMAGPMTWELAEDLGRELGCVALLTGHPDTLAKKSCTGMVIIDPAPEYQRGSFARRAFSWLRYIVCAFFWLWRWPKETPMLLFSNPPILCWLGWVMRLLRGQKYAVMVHDIYPDVIVRLQGMSERHPLIRAWRWLNRRTYQRAQVVMTLGEFMAENLARQFDASKTPAGRVEVVYPWVDTERIRPMPKAENWFAQKYGQVGKLTVMYSGNMGLGHDIETMVDTARLLRDEPDIHFMFIGAGPKWNVVKEIIQQHKLENITLLAWQSEEILPFSLSTADVTLVSLEPGMEGLAIPSKAIYALATGSSVIAFASENSELTRWFDSSLSSYRVDPGDKAELCLLLKSLVTKLDRQSYLKNQIANVASNLFSRKSNVQTLKQVLSILKI